MCILCRLFNFCDPWKPPRVWSGANSWVYESSAAAAPETHRGGGSSDKCWVRAVSADIKLGSTKSTQNKILCVYAIHKLEIWSKVFAMSSRSAALAQTEMGFGVDEVVVEDDEELKRALALSRQDIDVEDEEADLRRAIQLSMQGRRRVLLHYLNNPPAEVVPMSDSSPTIECDNDRVVVNVTVSSFHHR